MKTIEEIIVEKEFNELTQDELTMVAELAENEQEYVAMRSLFTQMNTDIIPESRFVASDVTKQSLDSIFMAKHPGIVQDWKREEEPAQHDKVVPLYNKTWFRAAAVLLLFSGTSYYYLQNSEVFSSEKQIGGQRQVAMSAPNKAEDETTSSSPSDFKKTDKIIQTPQALPSNAALAWASPVNEPSVQEDVSATYFSSATPVTKVISGPDKSKGLDADLYPNGTAIGNGSASGEAVASATDQLKDESTSDVSTAEMLDWIQTLY